MHVSAPPVTYVRTSSGTARAMIESNEANENVTYESTLDGLPRLFE